MDLKIEQLIPLSIIIILSLLSNFPEVVKSSQFSIKEATVNDIKTALNQGSLTSRQLVESYIGEIKRLNPILHGVIEVNPDALGLADKADEKRKANKPGTTKAGALPLAGIPIILKDNIATKDRLNTGAGSYALVGSIVARDAGVVKKLRDAGAIILGKASMTEWAAFRSNNLPNGWNARSGQTVNPYNSTADPCGSSSGSAVSVAANMATISLGTETSGSILCPSSSNSVVGIKPTVGLTSRAGVVPITPRQDTVGPICRTVSDAVYVLDVIVGFDRDDAIKTRQASKYIPHGGYLQFLKANGLQGKRLGIPKESFVGFQNSSKTLQAFEPIFKILRQKGAILVDLGDTTNFDSLTLTMMNDQDTAMNTEFKLALNSYLKQLVTSPVRSLASVITFNKKFSKKEKLKEYGQDIFEAAEKTNGIGTKERELLQNLTIVSKQGFEKLMKEFELDALVTPFENIVYAISAGGYPGINVPAGYDSNGIPFGISFGGLKGTEPKLIEIAYAFEQATLIRKPPPI